MPQVQRSSPPPHRRCIPRRLPDTHSWCLVPLMAAALNLPHPHLEIFRSLPSFLTATDELRRLDALRGIVPQRMEPVYFHASDQDRVTEEVLGASCNGGMDSALAVYMQECVDQAQDLLRLCAQNDLSNQNEGRPRPDRRAREPEDEGEQRHGVPPQERMPGTQVLQPFEARNVVWAYVRDNLGTRRNDVVLAFIHNVLPLCEGMTRDDLLSYMDIHACGT